MSTAAAGPATYASTAGGTSPQGGAGALAGVRVLRVGDSRAGDLLVRLLTEHGAQVTTVPGPVESAARTATQMLAEHDVLVDDAGRGVLAAYGLAPADAARHNGRLIHCCLVGLPPGADPADALPPSGDDSNAPTPATPPASTPSFSPSVGSTVSLPGARQGTADCGSTPSGRYELDDTVIAALLGMHQMSGLPPCAERLPVASLYGAALAAIHITAALIARENQPAPVYIEVPLLAAAATALSRNQIRLEDQRLIDIATLPHLPHVELYECADGRYLQPHGLYADFVRIICRVAGHPEWGDEAAAALARLPDHAAEQAWRERLRALFRQRPAADWERDINAAGGAATMVRSPTEWSTEPHAVAAQILASAPGDPSAASPTLPPPGQAVRVALTRAPAAGTARPPGAARPARGKGPLAGIKVIDFCIVLAGPTCARILADLGAEVIKVDDPRRPVSPYPWLDVNRGKRSTIIDLTTPDGVRLVRRLIEDADVVVQNFRSGKLDKLGFGEGALRSERPDLVYASLNAFDFDGPWERRAGWEHNAQAATGMQVLRLRDGVPRQVPFPVNDYATGLLGAYGVCLALLHRRRTGAGGHVRASLARSATYLLRVAPERADPYRPVECTDGWVWAAADPPHGVRRTRAATLAMFRAAGIPAVPELDVSDPHTRAWLRSHGIMTRWRHPRLGWIEQIAPTVGGDLNTTPGHPAPEPGDDTDSVLAATGIDISELTALRAAGVIGGPLRLFPDVPVAAVDHGHPGTSANGIAR